MDDASKEIGKQDYAEFVAEAADRLRFQVDFAQSAMRNLLLVNGGGILALLTLIGNSTATFDPNYIRCAFIWFGIGLAASLLAYFGAFLSQYYYMDGTTRRAWNSQLAAHGQPEKWDPQRCDRNGNIAMLFGFGSAALSLLFFVTGAFVALGGIL